jgi:hypothetical protein
VRSADGTPVLASHSRVDGTLRATRRVCVVIPVYQSELSLYERVSFEQCRAVLGGHPLVVVAPEGLAIPFAGGDVTVLRFPESHFASLDTYNRLLLTDAFYAAFADFEYILIHQLDAFVFRDELVAWCATGYDYWGAPWIVPVRGVEEWKVRLKRRVVQRLTRRWRSGVVHPLTRAFWVGNGGFSLRRVEAMRHALRTLPMIANAYRVRPARERPEDVFFGVETVMGFGPSVIRLPHWKQALRFAFEMFPQSAYQRNGGHLPFGCHDWVRQNHDFWRPHIRACGFPEI